MERSARPRAFLTAAERDRVQAAIAAAERETSGEIRVVVSRRVRGDALQAARKRFTQLKMQRTKERNGVLILLAVTSRRFAILGDEGIHRVVGSEGWERIRDGMAQRFRQDDFAGGLAWGVGEIGSVLRAQFPWQPGDVNELPDAVVEE
jgi:uncharacterized membrane protein